MGWKDGEKEGRKPLSGLVTEVKKLLSVSALSKSEVARDPVGLIKGAMPVLHLSLLFKYL